MKNSSAKAVVTKDDQLLFQDSKESSENNDRPVSKAQGDTWKLMIVDDDPVVHQVTLMVLDEYEFLGRSLEIIQAYSGVEARELIKQHNDVAVILLDVVMETDTAGLDTVKFIRDELNNHFTRIILRTGQPGFAPEKDVITEYDINDYKEKTELTSQKLFTCVTTALRAYHDLKKIQDLAVNNINLEQRIRERTLEIMKINNDLKGEVKERNKAYRKLQESEDRLNEAQRIASIGNWEWDIETDEITWSNTVCEIIGVNPSDTNKNFKDMLDAVAQEERDVVRAAFENAFKSDSTYDIDHRLVGKDGKVKYVHQQGHVERNEEGKVLRIAGTIQDVTQRYTTEEQMRKLSGAVDQIADSVMITDSQGVIEYVNPAFETMTGYSRNEVVGKNPNIVKSGKQDKEFYEVLWETILKGEVFCDVIINQRKNGELYHEEKTITPQRDHHGNIVHFISTGKDVTDRIEAQDRLNHLAHYDALTGLPNRVLLQDRLNQAMARCTWHKRNIAVMFMDIDRFKVVNDTLGHDSGDELLKAVSLRLLDCVRDGDTVSRLGGDEFAIVLNDVASAEDVIPVANKILDSLHEPLVVNRQELFITSSIGISLYPKDGSDCQELLKKADTAMYRAKSQGKDNFQIYSDEEGHYPTARLSIETQLRKALDRNEFRLNYQPQYSINEGQIIGFEALLRWRNDEFPNISPLQFIPILEETGMINAVGDWVLETACRQQMEWLEAGLSSSRVAVNMSIRQFKTQGLVERIETIVRNTGLGPGHLELELTEGLLIDQVDKTSRLLHDLHEMGVNLSIDDFGTGYSSMNYLKRLPFDILKIDRMFVRDITFNPDDAAITSAIISLGHTMGMEIIAEGVETLEQLSFLQHQGCDALQGYLYSPPLEAEAVMKLIKEGGPQLVAPAKGRLNANDESR